MGQKSSSIPPRLVYSIYTRLYLYPDKDGFDFSKKEKDKIVEKFKGINTIDKEIEKFTQSESTTHNLTEILNDVKK